MEDNERLIESLIERTVEYGKTSFELAKLKALDKISDVISTLVPQIIVNIFLLIFLLFFNLGIALWLGEVLGKTFYGFLVVAGFYGFIAIIVQLFMRNWLKKKVSNNIIKQVLK
jgi:hypothetical protein